MSPHYLEIFVIGLALTLLMADAFFPAREKRVIAWIGASGLAIVFGLLFVVDPAALPPDTIAPYYSADPHALFFKGLALIATIFVLLLGCDFMPVLRRGINGADNDRKGGVAESFILPLFACAGMMWMASATDLIFLFLSLELVTISFYVLVASMRRQVGSLEAGVKYLLLGALSTGMLVYGITWVFGATGMTKMSQLAVAVPGMTDNIAALTFGSMLVLAALAFKVGLFPFHSWIPDVYQGAPTPVTAFLAVASKAAAVLVLARFLDPFLNNPEIAAKLLPVLGVISGATLLFGNLGALGQYNFKRLMAYSSIAHAGFLLLGILGRDFTLVSFYLGAYVCMTLAAFFAISIVRRSVGRDDLSAFNGLARRNPALAFTLVVSAASLAGVPLTAGFIGKFGVLMGAVNAGYWPLVAVAVPAAAVGFYYYFKIVRHMFWEKPDDLEPLPVGRLSTTALALLTAGTLVLGFYPRLLERAIQDAPIVPIPAATANTADTP